MRLVVVAALVGLLGACTPPATSEAPVGEAAGEGFTMAPEAVIGTWSFDGSCASGDGMTLTADGVASYDEWGHGAWATADGNRLVLTLERREMGVDAPTGEHVTLYLDVAAPVTDELVGQIARDDGSEQRAVNARRCPSP